MKFKSNANTLKLNIPTVKYDSILPNIHGYKKAYWKFDKLVLSCYQSFFLRTGRENNRKGILLLLIETYSNQE